MKLTSAVIGFWFLSTAMLATAQEQKYVISTYAGGPPPPGVNTSINVRSIAIDRSENVYFAGGYFDGARNSYCVCVFKLDSNGALTRIAGTFQRGSSGDGGPATSAQLSPAGLAVDGAGNLFIADPGEFLQGGRIRKISPDGIITTVAGGGPLSGSFGDGGPATSAQLYYPVAVAVDGTGNLFFADSLDFDGQGIGRIAKVSPDGIITTVAGPGLSVNNFAVDSSGNVFVVNLRKLHPSSIDKISPDGIITTTVDAGRVEADCPDCSFGQLYVDPAGDLVFTFFTGNGSGSQAVLKLSSDGIISTVLENDDGLVGNGAMGVDGAGNLIISGGSLRKLSPNGLITTLVGDGACCYSGDGGPASSAQLNHAYGVAADSIGNLFIADQNNHRVRRVSPDGIITTVAGNGTLSITCAALARSSGRASDAQLCGPSQVAVDGAGNLFIVDGNHIRKVSPDGIITPVAGNGTLGDSGDGGLAIEAQLAYPNSVAVDGAGNLFIAEWARVRKISPDGIITTVAGNGTRPSSICSPVGSPVCGLPPQTDGGPATLEQLRGPASVTADGAGNLYFVDGVRIRKVSTGGIITTVAGDGYTPRYPGPTGDGGPATNTPLWASGVSVDSGGNLFISEPFRIRRVSPDGIITTVAGNGEPGYSGDGGPATSARLRNPSGVTVDGAGNVYIADSLNNAVRILRVLNSPF